MASGPVTVSLYADSVFMAYKNGTFNEFCRADKTNHAVTVVGWDVNKLDGSEYWIIRNSWGPKWGEDGHIRVKIGGNCNIGTAFLPYIA